MGIGAMGESFYADPASLSSLKGPSARQDPQALREVARQFESLFTTMMLKSMRQASPQDSLFGSDQQDFYQDLFDQQMATQLSKGRGLGLSDMLVRQLMQAGAPAGSGEAADAQAQPVQGAQTVSQAAWTPGDRDQFVAAILPAAREAGRRLGVDPANIVAHAALETGWGRSLPTDAQGRTSFNLFGIKAGTNWRGAAVDSPTREFESGRMRETSGRFRAYGSVGQCVDDYVRLIGGNARYEGVRGTGDDSHAFAQALKRGGYATDPDYAGKLARIAENLKLQLDPPITRREA